MGVFPVAGNKRKKNGVDTEMGYCPFEHKAGRHGRRHAGRWGPWAGQQARGARDTQAWAQLGRAAGPAGCALGVLSLF